MGFSDRRAVAFFRGFIDCVERTWKEIDKQYNIPKSRFSDERNAGSASSLMAEGPAGRRRFLRRFRDCVSYAWDASDRHYHIPKSRHGKTTQGQV